MKAQWTQTNGPVVGQVECMASLGTIIFAGTPYSGGINGGVYISGDNGDHWTSPSNAIARRTVLTIVTLGSDLYAGTQDNGVYMSTDSGATWTEKNSGINYYWIQSLIVKDDTTLFAGTHAGGIYRSTDRGENWVAKNYGLPDSVKENVRSLVVYGRDIFAGTDKHDVRISDSNGQDWYLSGPTITDPSIFSLATANGFIFAGGLNGGIFSTESFGSTWAEVNAGSGSWSSINTLLANGAYVFAGTQQKGVFLTTNSGTLWDTIPKLPTTQWPILSLIIANANLFAGTEGGGVFRIPLSSLGVTLGADGGESNAGVVPGTYSLAQNYPNPFNPSTSIAFSLPSTSDVSITIHDVLGREVATIVSEELTPGKHLVQWDAKNVSSGVYYYRMQAHQTSGGHAGVYVVTKKLLLMK